jgi:hypothetical protein
MSTQFTPYWDCPKKHSKRTRYWIPNAKRLRSQIRSRPFRYFTLCSIEMIDVFCLVRERVLHYDDSLKRISHVKFCEREEMVVPHIREFIGYEDSDFKGSLEDIVLFADSPDTQLLTNRSEIELYLDTRGESVEALMREKLLLKRERIRLEESFPFDFLNLDFCDKYYPNPPDTMRINATINGLIGWQNRHIQTEKGSIPLKRFLLSVTCRHDDQLSDEAYERLGTIVRNNKNRFKTYRDALNEDQTRNDINGWKQQNPFDFFISAWPKDLLNIMERHQWETNIVGVAYYDRHGIDTGRPYIMVLLLCDCRRSTVSIASTHESQSLKLLDQANRDKIEINPESAEGRSIKSHLKEIVILRNKQAEHIRRPLLPIPE